MTNIGPILCIQPDNTHTIHAVRSRVTPFIIVKISFGYSRLECPEWLYWIKIACTVDSYLMRNLSLPDLFPVSPEQVTYISVEQMHCSGVWSFSQWQEVNIIIFFVWCQPSRLIISRLVNINVQLARYEAQKSSCTILFTFVPVFWQCTFVFTDLRKLAF